MAVTSIVRTDIDHFESIYIDAQGDASRLPWVHTRPQGALVNWLNAVAPSLIRSGARVLAVGCGLGEDARELMRRGYDVTAFDCSATAIAWAKQIDPGNARCYYQADLFNPPPRWRHRFDLVVEVNTVQSLTPDRHAEALNAISSLMSPHGYLLVSARNADEPVSVDDGPPWPMTTKQLLDAVHLAGLKPVDGIAVFLDDEEPPVQRMRGLFRRA